MPSVALGVERCPEPTPVNADAAPGVGSLVGEPWASAGWAPSARPEGSEANERPAAWTAPGSAEGRRAEVEGACGPLSPCRGQREARRRGYAEGRGRPNKRGLAPEGSGTSQPRHAAEDAEIGGAPARPRVRPEVAPRRASKASTFAARGLPAGTNRHRSHLSRSRTREVVRGSGGASWLVRRVPRRAQESRVFLETRGPAQTLPGRAESGREDEERPWPPTPRHPDEASANTCRLLPEKEGARPGWGAEGPAQASRSPFAVHPAGF